MFRRKLPSSPDTPRALSSSASRYHLALAVAFGAVLLSCADDATPIPTTCNGSELLCSRSYSDVAYPTTHNSMSNQDEQWVNPNQIHGLAQQLDEGVRAFMLDTHYSADLTPSLCHALCQLGELPLVEGLKIFKSFLGKHRGEVLTMILETGITAEETAAAFEASGLLEYVHVQPIDSAWPTLRELIDADERLVVFTDVDGGAYPWYHDMWQYAWETNYAYRSADEFSCDINRGVMGNPLFIFNHFLTRGFGSQEFAEEVNFNPLLIDRAKLCQSEGEQLPNFVTVDFYSIGDLFGVVDTLNGL